jgi:hypothetical protein
MMTMIFKTTITLLTMLYVEPLDENAAIVTSSEVESIKRLALLTNLILRNGVIVNFLLINDIRS